MLIQRRVLNDEISSISTLFKSVVDIAQVIRIHVTTRNWSRRYLAETSFFIFCIHHLFNLFSIFLKEWIFQYSTVQKTVDICSNYFDILWVAAVWLPWFRWITRLRIAVEKYSNFHSELSWRNISALRSPSFNKISEKLMKFSTQLLFSLWQSPTADLFEHCRAEQEE